MSTKSYKEKLVCWIAYLLVASLHVTYRFRWYGREYAEAAKRIHPQGQVCLSIWHRNSLACLLAYAGRRLAVLISQSFDGEIIAYVARRFGIRSARGSSTRGGTEALRELIRLNKEGLDIGITVDGPTGPLYKVKPGILALAARGGNPVLPFAALGRRTWSLPGTWDGFRIPKPFTEILCLYGEPLPVPRKLDGTGFEQLARTLEVSLLDLERRLEEAVARGHRP